MKTPSRARIFLAPARGALAPLKEGQERCPMCCKGVGKNKYGGLAGHKSNGFPCAGPSIYKELAQTTESV